MKNLTVFELFRIFEVSRCCIQTARIFKVLKLQVPLICVCRRHSLMLQKLVLMKGVSCGVFDKFSVLFLQDV